MFHLLIILVANGQQIPLADVALNNAYPSRAACLADGRRRVGGMRSAGGRGRYLCMYEGESNAALRHETKVAF